MDGSSVLHNKCATTIHGGLDRISQLPDKIIVEILSFLTLRESARSSVLSSRWLDLWKHTPNLNFSKYLDVLNFDFAAEVRMSMVEKRGRGNTWDADECKYINLVNSVLQSHKAPSLKQFSISFYVNKSAQSIVAKWLEFVLSRGVERLELDFQCRDPTYKVVLEELLGGSGLCPQPQIDLTLFQSLKRLCLKYFKLSGEAIKMLLRNCPLLQALSIGHATLMSDVEVCGADLMLEHLEVYGCMNPKTIKVSAPNLTSLVAADGSGKLLLANVPKLVEADLRFLCPILDEVQHFASAVFCISSQLKTLSLTLQWPKMFLANEFFPQMPNLIKLVVDYHGAKTQSLLPITALVWASPRLEEFKLVFTEIRAAPVVQVVSETERSPHQHLKSFKPEIRAAPVVQVVSETERSPHQHLKSFKPEIRAAPVVQVVSETERSPHQHLKSFKPEIRAAPVVQVVSETERSPHQHLKSFKLGGITKGAVHLIELVNYISDNCVALQKVIIRSSPISAATYFEPPFAVAYEMRAAIDYAKQQLQGKLPQHIQLRLH